MKPLTLSDNLPGKTTLFASFSLCLLSSFLALKRLNYPLIGIDDANIYFVYARNLGNGHGFVYNAGGEKVEGFTSLLWTLICTLAFKFSTHPELFLLVINIVIVSLGIAFAADYLQHAVSQGDEKKTRFIWSALYLILIFSSPRYVVWNTVTLMENALWSTLLLLATIFVIRENLSPRAINLGFCPLAVLLLVTRPESNLWVAVFVGILFLRLTLNTNIANAFKTLMPTIGSATLTFVLLTMFRLYYFGYPFPNTYYAKVSPLFAYNLQQGLLYLSKYSVSDPIVTLCITAIFMAVLRSLWLVLSTTRIPNEGPFFLPFIAGVGLLEPLLVGGDHFGSFRMYQNIYPIEVFSLLVVLHQLFRESSQTVERIKAHPWFSKRFVVIVTVLLAVVFFQNQFTLWSFIELELGVDFRVAEYGRKSGAFIQGMFMSLPKLPSLGVVTSGGIKYSYSGEVIDLLGLNNTAMAHNQGNRLGIKDHAAFDIDTLYQLGPDIVWPSTVVASNWQYREIDIKESWENSHGLKGLFDEAHFQDLYTYAKVSVRSYERYALIGWFDREFLNSIRADQDFQIKEYEYGP